MLKRIKTFMMMAVALAGLMPMSCQKSTQDTTTNDSTTVATAEPPANVLTDEEKAAGWELLFDGNTLNGWKRYNQDSIGPLWTVDNGAIKCDGQGLTEGTANIGGSLITIKPYENFDLTLEWKV